MALISSNPKGNVVFHIALNLDGTLQPIMNARLRIEDVDLICGLLDAETIHLESLVGTDGEHYFVAYDANHGFPKPSAMIWKYMERNDDMIILDMDMEDLNKTIFYVVDNVLK